MVVDFEGVSHNLFAVCLPKKGNCNVPRHLKVTHVGEDTWFNIHMEGLPNHHLVIHPDGSSEEFGAFSGGNFGYRETFVKE